jgi:hypothetical protein
VLGGLSGTKSEGVCHENKDIIEGLSWQRSWAKIQILCSHFRKHHVSIAAKIACENIRKW